MDHIPNWEEFTTLGRNDEIEDDLTPTEIKLQRGKMKRAKDLYNQAREMYKYVAIFCDTLKGEMAEITSNMMMQNVLMICPKIIGAEAKDQYVFRMECASIIRTNCKELIVQVEASEVLNLCEIEYKDIVLSEMKKFKHLFKKWVKHFEKDKSTDDWLLFNQ